MQNDETGDRQTMRMRMHTNVHRSEMTWLRTNGVAAKVMNFDSLGQKVRPGTFGKKKVGKREYSKSPFVKRHEICSDPIGADPICPFPNDRHGSSRMQPRGGGGTLVVAFCGLLPGVAHGNLRGGRVTSRRRGGRDRDQNPRRSLYDYPRCCPHP